MSDASLATGSIARHLVRQTAPMILGIGCIMGVGLLDAWFIGQLGADELAAVSFIFPVSVALSSLGVGVMVGVNSVVSRAIGAGKLDRAAALAVQGIVLAFALGLFISGSLLLLQGPLFQALQAPDHLLPLIEDYITPYALGLPMLLVTMGANGALRAQGEAIKSSSILIIVALVNGALDPLLIFGWGPVPALGVAGAGWATALAHLIAMLTGLALVSTCELPLRPAMAFRGGLLHGMLTIGRVGAPASLSSAINPIGLTLLTAILARHGQEAVAGFGAAGRLQSFAVVPLLALSSSIGPIAGQNWGAGHAARACRALHLSTLFCLMYGLAVALTLVLLREPIAALFTDDAAIAAQIGRYLSIAAWGFAGYGCLVTATGALNAVDRAGLAFRLSVARVLLVMVPFAWLGSRLVGPGAVYGAELAANLIGGGAAYWFAKRMLSSASDAAADKTSSASTRPARLHDAGPRTEAGASSSR